MDGVIETTARAERAADDATSPRARGATEKVIRHRVRTGRWRQVHPNVFALLGAPLTPVALVHAAVLATGVDAVASHTTAAALLELPGSRSWGCRST